MVKIFYWFSDLLGSMAPHVILTRYCAKFETNKCNVIIICYVFWLFLYLHHLQRVCSLCPTLANLNEKPKNHPNFTVDKVLHFTEVDVKRTRALSPLLTHCACAFFSTLKQKSPFFLSFLAIKAKWFILQLRQ